MSNVGRGPALTPCLRRARFSSSLPPVARSLQVMVPVYVRWGGGAYTGIGPAMAVSYGEILSSNICFLLLLKTTRGP